MHSQVKCLGRSHSEGDLNEWALLRCWNDTSFSLGFRNRASFPDNFRRGFKPLNNPPHILTLRTENVRITKPLIGRQICRAKHGTAVHFRIKIKAPHRIHKMPVKIRSQRVIAQPASERKQFATEGRWNNVFPAKPPILNRVNPKPGKAKRTHNLVHSLRPKLGQIGRSNQK